MAIDRRLFLKRACALGAGAATAGVIYPLAEARWCHVVRATVAVPNLPPSFRGLTAALLADVHHGPYTPMPFVQRVVETTNAMRPDLILLAGDYITRSGRFIPPVMAALGGLRAPLGRFAVLGNHDHWENTRLTRRELDRAGIARVDNAGVWLRRGDDRLRICGVGDLWTDRQRPDEALADATTDDAVIMLSHNPDYAEILRDRRVGLMLSGHTHGGQVYLPGYGAPVVPSRYGQKYLGGLVEGPACRVFVSRGLGTTGPPVRLASRPEIVLLTLA
ncbi:putative metallophosphoesterase [Aquisphaera giovannonii]|uniref:Putative metallophosphoesterase n=1 Tax=Aquisphaera giovannonii TaxID=406548 RepID=A0A5B9WEY6_9BACT|nr:metallophosphoesterase [Aquisphaera giovannonii]QEH39107.1 putative metallophosphoesterase [Aquisphaera giovannonii]